jgi:hypothetical protein
MSTTELRILLAQLEDARTEATALRATEQNLRSELEALKRAISEAEPVAWMVMNGVCSYQLCGSEKSAIHLRDEMQKRHDLSGSLAAFHVRPLVYGDTHPAQQAKLQPLSDKQIIPMFRRRVDMKVEGEKDAWYWYAWGVEDGESAHGIKE